MVKLLETQNVPKSYPKLEPNKNPKVTQKLPKMGTNWVQLGSNRVPLGSPERGPLGSSWVPFGFPLGSSWVQLKKKPKSYPILSVNGCQNQSNWTPIATFTNVINIGSFILSNRAAIIPFKLSSRLMTIITDSNCQRIL